MARVVDRHGLRDAWFAEAHFVDVAITFGLISDDSLSWWAGVSGFGLGDVAQAEIERRARLEAEP